jgi:hypothetical protein
LRALVTILKANTKIQEVHDYEIEGFKGQPAVVIVPSSNESSYESTNDNERIYAFNLFIFVSRTKYSGNPKSEADRVMRGLIDTILDDIDKNWTLDTVVQPTGYTFLNIFATPSSWGYANMEDEYRTATIEVKCRVSVDVTLIS